MASNGTRVADDGRVRTNAVANTYVPIGTDVYINGTLHDSVGNMYITVGANQGSDILINGIRHTVNGVRVTQDAAGSIIAWPEGFNVETDGRQGTVTGVQANFIRGIGRSTSTARMSILAA